MFEGPDLIKLANLRMPYGRYKNRLLMDLPEAYLLWFAAKGLPEGELGRLLGLMLEIDRNGLKHLLVPLKNATTSA